MSAEHAPAHTVGIVYQERSQAAHEMAERLATQLRQAGREVWLSALLKGAGVCIDCLPGTDVLLVLGGDGTILSAARMCASDRIPILGVNFGRVGFLTELEPTEVEEQLPLYLSGDYWVDERAMLLGEVQGDGAPQQMIALNDIVLVRGAEPRIIRIKVWLDGHYYNTTVADGIIISTATGSTAYNLAAGGPILHPQVRSSVITPVAPHLVADRSLILEPGAVITLELEAGSGSAILSADGQINMEIHPGTQVAIRNNAHVTRFLRRRPPTYFYRILSAKLRDSL
jgi:NAD+ kinase